MLADDLAMALDPALLFTRAVGAEPDPWQAAVLRTNAARVLLNITRQGGKSTTTAALSLHTALYVPEALVLLLSPSLRQSQELFLKLTQQYVALGQPVPSDAVSALRLTLANGSRVIALPGTEATIRGYSGATLLVIDEASRVDDALYFAVRPMLAVSGGRLLLLSTPFGARGVFYDEWKDGSGWERYEVPATDCPRISPAFLAEERRALGPLYDQEYGCQFIDSDTQVFSSSVIERAFSNTVPVIDDDVIPFTRF